MATSGLPVAELFARLGIDPTEFKTGLQQAIQDMEVSARGVDTIANRMAQSLDRAAGRNLFRAVDQQIESLGGTLRDTATLLGTDAGRFAVGLQDTAVKAGVLKSALKDLGASTVETDFLRQTRSFNVIREAFDAGQISARTFQDALRNYGATTRELDAYLSGTHIPTQKEIESQQRATAEATRRSAREVELSTQHYRQLASDVRGLGVRLSVGVTAPLVALGIGAFKAAGEMEVARTSLTRMTGSAEEATRTMTLVRQLSLQSPLNFSQTLEATRRVIANLRVDGSEATRVVRILTDTVSATGAGEEAMLRLVKALSDVKNQGFLAGQEIRQFANANVNVVEIISNKLGVSAPKVLELIKDKAIDANTAINAILEGLDKKFGGEGLVRVGTLPGQLQQLKEQFRLTLADVGELAKPASQAFIDLGKVAVSALQSIVSAAKELPTGLQIPILAGAGVAASVGPAITAIGDLSLSTFALANILRTSHEPMKVFGKETTLAAVGTRALGFSMRALPWVGLAAGTAMVIPEIIKARNEIEKTFDEFEEFQRLIAAGPAGAINRFDRGTLGGVFGQQFTKEQGRAASLTLGIRIAKPKTEEDTKEELDKLAKAAKEAEQARAKLFSDAGITDHTLKVKEAAAAYTGLSKILLPLQRREQSFEFAQVLIDALDAGGIKLSEFQKNIDRFNLLPFVSALRDIEAFKEEMDSLIDLKGATEGAKDAFFKIADAQVKAQIEAHSLASAWRDLATVEPLVGAARSLQTFENLFANFIAATDEKGAMRILGVEADRDLEQMRLALGTLSILHGRNEVSINSLNKATLNYYNEALRQGGKLTREAEKHRQELQKQIGVVGILDRTWRAVGRQVSTIITDFGRGIIDILFPRDVEQAADPLIRTFQDAFNNLSNQGFTRPQQALETIINQIRTATDATRANEIALRHFGDIGPEIARQIRTGQLSVERLNQLLSEAPKAFDLEKANDKISKFNRLLAEARTAILRAFVEAGANAVASFVGKHLKDLLSGLDDVLFKIPLIGKGLEAIFGRGGAQIPGIGIPGGAPPISRAPVPPIPGGIPPTQVPPTQVPTAPIPAGQTGAATSALSRFASTLNVVTGAISAVADVFSAVGIVRLEGTMNRVEKNTAEGSIHLLHILENTNKYLPFIQGLVDRTDVYVVPLLRQIRDGSAARVTLAPVPGSQAETDLINSIIDSNQAAGTTLGDRLADIHFVLTQTASLHVSHTDRVVGAIVGFQNLVVPQLRALQPSLLEKILGFTGIGGGGGGIGSLATGVAGGLASGPAGLLGSLATAIFGDRKEGSLNQIERNTAAGSIHLLNILTSTNTYLPAIRDNTFGAWSSLTQVEFKLDRLIEQGNIAPVVNVVAAAIPDVIVDAPAVNIAPPVVNVQAPEVQVSPNLTIPAPVVNVQPASVPEVVVQSPTVSVDAPTVNVPSPVVNVAPNITVPAPVVNVAAAPTPTIVVEAPSVDVAAPNVNVPSPVVNVSPNVTVPSPVVNVAAPPVPAIIVNAPSVDVAPPVVNVPAPVVNVSPNVFTPAPVVNVAAATAPDINIDSPNIQVDAPIVNVQAPDPTVVTPKVDFPTPIINFEPNVVVPAPVVNVAPALAPDVTVEPPVVNVAPPSVTVQAPEPTVVLPPEINIPAPVVTPIKAEAPVVNVAAPIIEAPTVNVAAPNVNLAPPVVNVQAPEPTVILPPAVTVPAPVVNVGAPDVKVEAPVVQVPTPVVQPPIVVPSPVVGTVEVANLDELITSSQNTSRNLQAMFTRQQTQPVSALERIDTTGLDWRGLIAASTSLVGPETAFRAALPQISGPFDLFRGQDSFARLISDRLTTPIPEPETAKVSSSQQFTVNVYLNGQRVNDADITNAVAEGLKRAGVRGKRP